MPIKIMNRDALIEERLKNKTATHAVVFSGNATENLTAANPTVLNQAIVEMTNNHWVGSAGNVKLWDEIKVLQKKFVAENAAQAPDAETLAALVSKIFIDMTRRAQESPDLTSMIATEITNFDFPENVTLRDIMKYRGKFMKISGTNDSVPLIEQNLANVDTFPMEILALGWKDSIKNMLYNSLHNMQKVLEAVVDAHTDARNSKTVGMIVGATYVATQKQAADATASTTFDEKMYTTLRKAVKKLKGLKDIQTDRPISVPSMMLLCNSANTWDIERVVNGQLDLNGAAGARGNNRQALPIASIVEYDRGITDGFTWGEETLSFPGVTAGKAYLFVPKEYLWVGNKRPLTMETGRGSVLQLSTEERAWYGVQGEYTKVFLGSSFPSTSVGAGYGAIIEITLPTES